jgi:putative redox protein
MSAPVTVKLEKVANVTSRATVRTHRLTVDRPAAKGGADKGPAGGEYLVVGLGGCFMSHLLAAMQARGVEVRDVGVTAEGTMDGVPERFTSFALAVTGQFEDIELGRKVVAIAGRGCQVVNTLRRSAPVTISFNGADIVLDDPKSAA